MNNTLLINLLLSHLIVDFYLQSNSTCDHKIEKGFKSWFLYLHALFAGVFSWALVAGSEFWKYALLIFLSHLVIDGSKALLSGYFIHKKEVQADYKQPISNFALFSIDQILHIAIIGFISFYYKDQFWNIFSICTDKWAFNLPLAILMFLICLKPANIIIKLVLDEYKIGLSSDCEEIKNAGALIGDLERILTLVFVILGKYEAVGFLIAAKSILRFRDTHTAKTEYVLAGTFLSFGIAILCGIIADCVWLK